MGKNETKSKSVRDIYLLLINKLKTFIKISFNFLLIMILISLVGTGKGLFYYFLIMVAWSFVPFIISKQYRDTVILMYKGIMANVETVIWGRPIKFGEKVPKTRFVWRRKRT